MRGFFASASDGMKRSGIGLASGIRERAGGRSLDIGQPEESKLRKPIAAIPNHAKYIIYNISYKIVVTNWHLML
jgi:hypothetical protein